ncbi:MAG: Chromate resistance protein ChrB [Acidimicrobiales bacterium]
MESTEEGSPTGWLLLVYRIPSEPTRLRAGVWRRLKGLGAIYVQSSTAALPGGPAEERALRGLRNEIVEMGGSAFLLTARVLAGEPALVAAFNAARDDEYEEIVDRCEDFLRQVAKEYEAAHFTFAELEENDVDLVKLRSWYEKVRARDRFEATGSAPCEEALARCDKALEDYANRVYAEVGDGA